MSELSLLSIAPDTPWLAPLAGWSDLPFRLLCRERGAKVCCTEMVSAKGMIYGSPGTSELLSTIEKDSPLVVQLFGNDPDIVARAMDMLLERGFSWFDLNMGCSVPKVMRTGCGAAMLKDVKGSLKVAEAMLKKAGTGRVGFKLRLGVDYATPTWEELGRGLADLGAGWLTLHPRYARQGFSGTADWSCIAGLKKLVHVPVVASGDLLTAQAGAACLEQTGADGVMYGRGAMRNPEIFAAHTAVLAGMSAPERGMEEIRADIMRHAELASLHSPMRVAVLKMRTIVPHYVYDVPEAKHLRRALVSCRGWDEFERVMVEFFGDTGEALCR